MMDKYTRVARVYPAVLGMLPTCILLAMCLGECIIAKTKCAIFQNEMCNFRVFCKHKKERLTVF